MKAALFGGIYNNHLALRAAIDDAQRRGAQKLYCLGDLGAFGPHPDRVWPLLLDAGVECVQGNYDHSIGHRLRDCQCGYTDPRDNHFAQLSYDYTDAHTSAPFRQWLRDLPAEIRFDLDGHRVLLCHGSPRRTNEFLWESTTSTPFLERLADEHAADVICGTHTGLHWERALSRGRRFVNVGVLGRPENDGTSRVWYALLSTAGDGEVSSSPQAETAALTPPHPNPLPRGRGRGDRREDDPILEDKRNSLRVEFIPVDYDHERLAEEMRAERLPEEFVQTILTGWWTTCLEVLPARERRRGRF
jgi:diadenosine tetraphosphatase ApaH/serine/threonine PP2A family protein phosphatase